MLMLPFDWVAISIYNIYKDFSENKLNWLQHMSGRLQNYNTRFLSNTI